MADSVFSAPSLQRNDFLAAFGLDRADIKAIDISQDSGSLIISLELNIKEHRCPICHSPTTKVKAIS